MTLSSAPGHDAAMSPPKFTWPTRPCPLCGADVPIHRWEPQTMRMLKWQVYGVVTVVNWCGHAQEFILLPEADGWCREIPVLGEAA